MHSATQSGRLRPTTTFALILALSSLFSLAAFGQQGGATEEATTEQKIQELTADLRARSADLEELKKTIEKHDDSATAPMMDKELSDRRARYRRDVSELVTLVLEGEDAGATVADGRALAADILKKDARAIREKLQELAAETLQLLNVTATGSAEEVAEARKTLASAIPRSSRLMRYLDVNIEEREQLGLDVEADKAFMIKRLGVRADIVAGLLQNSKEEIDEIVARPGSDQDVEAQKELAALKDKRDALAESQRSNVRLMDEYGLETAELRQGIITATGKLSQDILNKDVAAGLVEQWVADATDWLRSNGAALISPGSHLPSSLGGVLVYCSAWARRSAQGSRSIEAARLQPRARFFHQDDGPAHHAIWRDHRDCSARDRGGPTACRPRHRRLGDWICVAGHALEFRVGLDDPDLQAL